MKLAAIKQAFASLRKADELEVLIRFTNSMGQTETLPVAAVIEEIEHGQESSPRRIILTAQQETAHG